ncbi:alkaline phosphatase D family protein [Haloterrigena sp. SYSU A121-1]|uniref:Alkaline phosphatase D family protein n=1 Tax=Haloterrigena gelatinilytica TaxID=2741724 RepID=A0A8J8GJS0_9EURY|nr:alkaline phosphatase D family protein [Haloterrigena gelatinilytica]NUB91283.1 alkaline phosphatase D family protein [Haloterrigena gelatinilytica]
MTDTHADMRAETATDNRRTFLQTIGLAATATGLVGTAAGESDSDESTIDGSDADLVSISHGVAVGDVTATTAVVWARAADEATIHVAYSPDQSFDRVGYERTTVGAETDTTGQLRLEGLESNTRYRYHVWATASETAYRPLNGRTDGPKGRGPGGSKEKGKGKGKGKGNDDHLGKGRGPEKRPNEDGRGNDDRIADALPDAVESGTFVTAPAPDDEAAVSFAWSGDTWGYGDDPVEPPFPGLRTIAERDPDFFLYHGDTIYADALTPAGKVTEDTPIDEALEIYRGKYKEMRDPPAEVAERTNLLELLETTSVYTVWDDHEVINNFAGPIEPLMPEGRRAFREYWPLDRDDDADPGESNRFYDSFRWGKHVELFLLDTRQYRDPNVDLDSKTLLGREQLEWLKGALADSDATWKLLASPAPLGYPSDSWATEADRTGYEAELLEVVEHVQTEPVSNLVVVAGDVHKSVVSAYDPDDDGEFEFFEAVAGPLGAPAGEPDDLYPALNPTEFFAKGEYRNFATVDVAESGETLTIGIYDEHGTEQFTKTVSTSDIDAAADPENPDRIESTFDEDAEGWLVSQNGGSNRPVYHGTGGNPGGHIGDAENEGGVAWYYQAPFEYLGDREAFYGGTLSFDLRQEPTDQQFDAEPVEGGDVLLQSGDRKLVYEFRGADDNPGEEWTSYEVALSADETWIDLTSREPLATEERFREVLADLEVLRIRGEYRSGDDTSYLDNVVLTK